jgi:hypothetical protein
MKMLISFICGAAICLLMLYCIKPVLPAFAQDDPSADESENVTQNVTQSLTSLIPDIQKIYRQALTAPFIQVESEIKDKDIAAFYHSLMEKTGLTDPNSN